MSVLFRHLERRCYHSTWCPLRQKGVKDQGSRILYVGQKSHEFGLMEASTLKLWNEHWIVIFNSQWITLTPKNVRLWRRWSSRFARVWTLCQKVLATPRIKNVICVVPWFAASLMRRPPREPHFLCSVHSLKPLKAVRGEAASVHDSYCGLNRVN